MTTTLQTAGEWNATAINAIRKRDGLIVKAHMEGHSLRTIAKSVGLSHQTIANIINGP